MSNNGNEHRHVVQLISDEEATRFIQAQSKDDQVEDDVDQFDPWKIRHLQDAFSNKGKQAPWVIENLLLAKSAALVSAQPKAMKSLSLLQACMEAAARKKVWGHFAAPKVRNTLFVETEDPQGLVESRIRGLAKGLGLGARDELAGFHYVCVGPFDVVAEAAKLQGLITSCKADFAVLSTMQNMIGDRDWNSQQNMQPVMKELIKMSRTCPLVLVTHSPQDRRHRRAAGTITQAANFATALHYEKSTSKGQTSVQVRVDSKIGTVTPRFSLRLEIDTSDAGDSVRGLVFAGTHGSNTMGIIEDALEDNPEISNDELADLTNTGVRNIQKIRKALTERTKAKRRS